LEILQASTQFVGLANACKWPPSSIMKKYVCWNLFP
jgi:hypothetical protein